LLSCLMFCFFFFFFFQAEDGIRDLYVTGVQTCALPILTGHIRLRAPTHLTVRSHGSHSAHAEASRHPRRRAAPDGGDGEALGGEDRKSVVKGKSVDLGGRGIIKKKK